MLNHRTRPGAAALAIVAFATLTAAEAFAAPSTSRGQISVAQVREMLDRAATNPAARQTLTAYLAGTGEAAGWLLDAAADRGLGRFSCTRRLALDDKTARQALESGSANATSPTETAATPLILQDMLMRAGCRLGDQ